MAVILGSSPIKSIQRGSMSLALQSSGQGLPGTATINAVDVAKSFVSVSCRSASGFSSSSSATGASLGVGTPTAGAALTNSTTVTANMGNVPFIATLMASTAAGVLFFEVIEYV